MKHLYAGAVVGGVLALLIAATVVMWAFLSVFLAKEVAALLTGGIILVMAASAVLDLITEKNA